MIVKYSEKENISFTKLTSLFLYTILVIDPPANKIKGILSKMSMLTKLFSAKFSSHVKYLPTKLNRVNFL